MARYTSDVLDYDMGSPEEIYELCMDQRKHAFVYQRYIEEKDIEMGNKEGDSVKVYNGTSYKGFITGQNLLVIPNRMIVQSLRSELWGEDKKDVIVVMTFEDFKEGTRVRLVNNNIPDGELQVIDRGMFFELWRVFVRGDKDIINCA